MINSKVTISSSPHIRSEQSTAHIMRDVLIALVPACFCGILFFGIRALWLMLVSVSACLCFEFLWQKLTGKEIRVTDGSAAVTGLLLAMNLPSTAPWWMTIIGAFIAVIITKELFGGIGSNFMNPALAGRVFLSVSWPLLMSGFVEPFSGGLLGATDVISTATPLAILKSGEDMTRLPSVSQMFFGNIAGCIGETSALALLLGGLYLIGRRVISVRIPLAYLGSVALLTWFFGKPGMNPADAVFYQLFSGGLMLGAFFMATDYVTSPVTPLGQILMGIGCGLLTFFIRRFGGYAEGVSYAILLMNIVTPLIDKCCQAKPYGHKKNGR